jgi:HEAT repeat protein
MGTNALPFLIRDLQYKDWPLRDQAYWLNTKLLKRKIHLGPAAWFRHEGAMNALIALGPVAKPAIPALNQCLDRDDIAVEAVEILGYHLSGPPPLGPEAAVPLLRALTNRNLSVRRIAANSLGLMQTRPKEVVPALIRTLQDPSAEVRRNAAGSLGGPVYKQEADTIVPALIKTLKDTDPTVRRWTAWRLGRYRARAHECVPKLVSLLSDSDQEVRKEAADALKLIDPEAATNAGIK